MKQSKQQNLPKMPLSRLRGQVKVWENVISNLKVIGEVKWMDAFLFGNSKKFGMAQKESTLSILGKENLYMLNKWIEKY